MPARALFKLQEKAETETGTTLRMVAVYDDSIPMNRSFTEFTPSGTFEMFCTNPAANEQFEVGKSYYLDITPAN